ncbi:hypothetical protein Ddye_019032 [Dipteronia dyeriana]|uniref:B-block binding subunit of TFIIIC domain-containing protein n=1 Tax=Dipteronia dyeriana TaxID=168575 RepID=A0AAD9TXC4_9ROSI|nr:hypothetical protein Ddye_019032 [Dipteronia dyeriana]
MDSLVSSALDEICSQGQTGLPISSLWPKLESSLSPSLSPSLRASLHSNLLKIPSLQFRSQQNASLDAADASIQRVDEAERLGLRIVASSKLADCFAGLENGITQTQLEKEFGIKAENFFYKVKNLECKGLIVRTKETSGVEGESKSSSCRSTKMMYLHRYAKHLSAQQKLEISKEGQTVDSFGKEYEIENATNRDSFPRESFTQDVHVKDYLPAMEAICKKLEEANGKVLVRDLKQDLDYRGSPLRHRSWRKICQRLKDSGTIEEFDEVVNKVQHCMHLLKKNSLKEFEQNSLECGDNTEKEQQMKFGRRSPKNEQLVELPIEHQIYDMVDAEGSEGLTVIEVCDRLGIENKRNYSRFCNMFTRFGMHLQSENHKTTVAFRVWTSGNSNTKSSNPFISKSKIVDGDHESSYLDSDSTSEGDFAAPGENNDAEINIEIPHGSIGNGRTNHMLPCPGNLQESIQEPSGTNLKDGQADVSYTNPYPLLTADGLRREKRILERLQQGLCKYLYINSPVLSNCDRIPTEVVLHPSIQNLTPDLLGETHNKVRSFEMQIRGRGSSRWKKDYPVPVLDGAQRTQNHVAIESDDNAIKLETMRVNGFVQAKMVRAKLLHKFLWSYLSSSSGSDDALLSGEHIPDFISTHSSCKLFSLKTVIKNIPLELFSQVAGATHKIGNTIEKCKKGLRLSDLPVQEYKRLMDTQATGKLSKIIDILRQLKLIRLVANGHSDDGINIHANLTHAMEVKPYIEEPPSVFTTSNFTSLDLHPPIRHDFILSSEEAVDEYWQTLEYFYAAADRRAALHAFPGSAVQEVLPMYYDKKHQRLNRFQGAFSADKEGRLLPKNKSSPLPHKRRKSFEEKSVKWTAGEDDFHMPGCQEDDHLETVKETGPTEEDDKCNSILGQRTFSNSIGDRICETSSSSWTKIYRVKWTLLSNLPASPNACAKRMSLLKENKKVKDALMKLCNILSERYVKHLEKTQSNDDCRPLENASPGKVITRAMPAHTEDAGFEENHWDDFDDINIKRVLEGVLQLKQMAKLEASTRVGSTSRERSNSISKYPFPIDTGRRAANFSSQLHERKNDLIEQGINLDADLQCGDILHLFYLVSSGELSISPCLPDEEGALSFRREKGIPGITVSVHRATITTADAVEMFKDGETCTAEHQGNAELNSTLGEGNGGSSCQSDCTKEVLDVESVVTVAGSSSESPWGAMTTYAEYLLSPEQKEVSFFSPQVFETVFAAIQTAGDQGLRMEEVSHVLDMPGEKISGCTIDVLQVFGRALKVNADDSVCVFDALYRSKFFLTSIDGFRQDRIKSLSDKVLCTFHQPENHNIASANSRNKMKRKADNMHLNLPEAVADHLNETSSSNVHEDSTKGGFVWPGGNNNDESYKFSFFWLIYANIALDK